MSSNHIARATGEIRCEDIGGRLSASGALPPYLGPDLGRPENESTLRPFIAWNLRQMARSIKDVGGIPAHGNQKSEWDAGSCFDDPNPDYR